MFYFLLGTEIALLLSAMHSQLKKPSEQTHWNDNLVCVCTHREYLEACQPRIKAVVVISFSRATWKESGEESGISSLFSLTRRQTGSRVTQRFVMERIGWFSRNSTAHLTDSQLNINRNMAAPGSSTGGWKEVPNFSAANQKRLFI